MPGGVLSLQFGQSMTPNFMTPRPIRCQLTSRWSRPRARRENQLWQRCGATHLEAVGLLIVKQTLPIRVWIYVLEKKHTPCARITSH